MSHLPKSSPRVIMYRRLDAIALDVGAITALQFSPNGKRLISGHADGWVLIWDVSPFESKLKLRSPGRITRVLFLPDGRRFLVADAAGNIALWALPD